MAGGNEMNTFSKLFTQVNEGLQEAKEILVEQKQSAPMVDMRYAGNSMGFLALFFVILFAIGAGVIHFNTDPTAFQAVLFFLAGFFGVIILALWSLTSSSSNMRSLIKQGRPANAIVVKRREIEDPDDGTVSYYYICTFNAFREDGGLTEIKAQLPLKAKDVYQIGDSLPILYLPQNPKICTEVLSDVQYRSLFSKRGAWASLLVALVCVGITAWGFQSVLLESVSLSSQNLFSLATWEETAVRFYSLMKAHPVEKFRLELFMLAASCGVFAYALYLLLRPMPQTRSHIR